MPTSSAPLLADLVTLCSQAGARILAHYGHCSATAKRDGSPLTEADLAADAVIAQGLEVLYPGIPVLSEEAVERFDPAAVDDRFILVDPLDGTREFLSGNGEFTVNVAIIEDHRPVAGVVYAPVAGRAWAGVVGTGAEASTLAAGRPVSEATERRRIRVCSPASPLRAAVSRSHCDPLTERWLSHQTIGERINAGSSLKFCLVAEGLADIYPRFGPTNEWDTAAGHAVLAAAGGVVLTPEGQPFLYGKAEDGFRNGPFVAACAGRLIRAN